MTITITVRLTEEQIQKINKSGLTKSEYTRTAIDYFSENKLNASILSKINIVEECISLLEGYRDDLKNNMISTAYQNLDLSYEIDEQPELFYKNKENVIQNDENLSYKNGKNVKKIYKNGENVIQNVLQNDDEMFYKNSENVIQMRQDPAYPEIQKYMETLSKQINIHGNVLEAMKTKINHETTLTPKQISRFIAKYKNEIKQVPYKLGEHTQSQPDGKICKD
ncbi:hypothetical protein PXD04_10075 [Methanosphaera sp. ISO3-F5]|uniref:hypothetical protein n=1 Tax=Methanosphaera sp. ISO3-F5 TaxID=1452353 RepID=UPI002B26219A|nr:hypothetical protein [Methanosphaera sp. ISO3-F5]WQH64036.1 hypothetical protein PXD04_10075 [Methanosphaera sp. ISO3-F5]